MCGYATEWEQRSLSHHEIFLPLSIFQECDFLMISVWVRRSVRKVPESHISPCERNWVKQFPWGPLTFALARSHKS